MPMPTLRSVPERVLLAMPLLALVALAVTAAWLGYPQFRLLGEAVAPPAQRPLMPASPAVPVREPAPLAKLATSRLFGEVAAGEEDADDEADDAAAAAEEAPMAQTPPESLPLASLGVTVRGILFHPEPSQRQALLAGAGVEEGLRTYRVGDDLPGTAVIRFIEPRRIVVERAGALEELPLPRLALDTDVPQRAAATAPPRAATGATPADREAIAARLRSIARHRAAPDD